MTGAPLRLLTIAGNPGDAELMQAWQDILFEYSSLIKTEKSQSIFAAWQKFVTTQNRFHIISAALYALKIQYDEQIAQTIHDFGYDLIEYSEDRQVYLRRIYAIEKEAKVLVVLTNQYMNEYKALTPEVPHAETGDAEQYERELVILSKFMGHRLDKNAMTVSEFCAIANLYLETNKKQKDGATV